jgi:uncharacterized protein involved in exopolysaccharide biosynthesis
MSQSDADKFSGTNEISIRDLVNSVKRVFQYLKSKWIIILAFALIGAALGFSYALLKKPRYTATCTFVLENAKGGGLGQYSGLASLAGINIGGEGGGIFEGDNILELYKSRAMIEKTLLSTANFNGKNELLIDRYIESYHLRAVWQKQQTLSNIKFNNNPDSFNRQQDSIITDLVGQFNKIVLNVSKPDKKLNIISVEVTTKDELFSKAFNERLVQTVNDFYIQTKTKNSLQNLQVLQHQADSVKAILNSSINGVASANDAAPNANPLLSTLRVSSQKKQVDVQANSAIYGEILKNLELAKISLRQEMPLIQVIDKPVLPLYEDKVGKISSTILGALTLTLLTISFLFIKRLFDSVLS